MGTKASVGTGRDWRPSTTIIATTLYQLIGIIACYFFCSARGFGFEPDFSHDLKNLTVPVGRDAIFTCIVNHLGGYRVGWIKLDTKAIQAIGNTVITHNPRVSVTHSGQSIWNLHISSVQPDDAGPYGCQINTNPMKSQAGVLEVTVPPDIVDELTPSDITVKEESSVKLVCQAKGIPTPKIVWRREDGSELSIKEDLRRESNLSAHGSVPAGAAATTVWDGEVLRLPRVLRQHSGPYLCIASNGVPPPVSKRVMVNVQFAPSINVLNQLIGAPVASDVVLECTIEASPRPISYWTKDGTLNLVNYVRLLLLFWSYLGPFRKSALPDPLSPIISSGADDMVVQSNRFLIDEVRELPYRFKLTMTIKFFRSTDAGRYHCHAKNSLGEAEGTVRIYEIVLPPKVWLGTDNNGNDDEDNTVDNAESMLTVTTLDPSTTTVSTFLARGNQSRVPIGHRSPNVKQIDWDSNDSIRHRPKLPFLPSGVSRPWTSDAGWFFLVILSCLCKLFL